MILKIEPFVQFPTLARALPSYHGLGETLLASIQTFRFAFMQTVPVCHDQIP
jgi:hypothetical protein